MAVSLFNIFTRRRVRVAHPDAPSFYTMHSGDMPNAGAQHFAFQPRFSNPIFKISGSGNIVGAMRVINPAPMIQTLSLPVNASQGMPVGSMALQGLITDPTLNYSGE